MAERPPSRGTPTDTLRRSPAEDGPGGAGSTLPSAVPAPHLTPLPAPAAVNAQGLRIPPPSLTTLRGEILEHAPPQRVRVRYPVDEAWLNPYGVLQGGFFAAMFDNVVGMCAYANDPSRQSATLEMSIRFFRSVRTGHVIVDGAVLRAGRTTITIECVAWDDRSELCAKATATNMYLG